MIEINGWKLVNIETQEEILSGTDLSSLTDIPGIILAGYKELKNVCGVFISDDEIVVTGDPEDDDENHNCDDMGCSSVSHVIFRANI